MGFFTRESKWDKMVRGVSGAVAVPRVASTAQDVGRAVVDRRLAKGVVGLVSGLLGAAAASAAVSSWREREDG